MIYRLFYYIDRLRQFKRLWNQKVITFLKSFGFYTLNIDVSILIYHRKNIDNIKMISIYIDNFLLAIKYWTIIDKIKNNFKKKYNIKDFDKVKTIIS